MLAGPVPARAAEVSSYEECLALAASDPEAAYEAARGWEGLGGGLPARHCAGLALVAADLPEAGAEVLQALADEPGMGGREARASVLAQAASAWMVAGKPRHAIAALDAGLVLVPGDPDLLGDRGRAKGLIEDDAGAIADLTAALQAAPDRAGLLVLRAVSYRYEGQYDAALADLARALEIAPGKPEALLERGLTRERTGDIDGARADYVAVLAQVGEGPTAEAARDALETLDVKPGG